MKKLLLSLALAALSTSVVAQTYPDRPLKVVVPFPAGQASDVITRVVVEQLAKELGQPIVVENRVGAGGAIGTEAGARAKADGYTLTTATAALPISKYVRKLAFDPERDFTPVALMTVTPLVMVTRPDLPANSVRDVVEMAHKEPGKYTFASSGVGTSHHLAGELFRTLGPGNLDLLHVPYQGSAAAHIDLIAGRVDIMFDNIVPVTPHLAEKKLKALAVTTTERARTQPDLPTMAEAGYPEFEAVAWFGLLAPAGTPADVIDTLNRATNAALRAPAVKNRLEGMGAFVQNRSAAEFAQFLEADFRKWAPVVKRANIQVE